MLRSVLSTTFAKCIISVLPIKVAFLCEQVVQITDALSKGVSHNLDLRIHA